MSFMNIIHNCHTSAHQSWSAYEKVYTNTLLRIKKKCTKQRHCIANFHLCSAQSIIYALKKILHCTYHASRTPAQVVQRCSQSLTFYLWWCARLVRLSHGIVCAGTSRQRHDISGMLSLVLCCRKPGIQHIVRTAMFVTPLSWLLHVCVILSVRYRCLLPTFITLPKLCAFQVGRLVQNHRKVLGLCAKWLIFRLFVFAYTSQCFWGCAGARACARVRFVCVCVCVCVYVCVCVWERERERERGEVSHLSQPAWYSKRQIECMTEYESDVDVIAGPVWECDTFLSRVVVRFICHTYFFECMSRTSFLVPSVIILFTTSEVWLRSLILFSRFMSLPVTYVTG